MKLSKLLMDVKMKVTSSYVYLSSKSFFQYKFKLIKFYLTCRRSSSSGDKGVPLSFSNSAVA